jgi:hypothetical protein
MTEQWLQEMWDRYQASPEGWGRLGLSSSIGEQGGNILELIKVMRERIESLEAENKELRDERDYLRLVYLSD